MDTPAVPSSPMGRPRRLPRYVEAVKLARCTRYRSWLPGGSAGKRKWLPLCDTPEEAAQMRVDALGFEARGIGSRAGWTWVAVTDGCAADMEARCRPATVSWYRAQVRALSVALLACGRSGDAALANLDADVWREVQRLRLSQVSPSSVAHHWRALRQTYRWAMANGVAVGTPLDVVPVPRVRDREMEFISESEFWPLLDAIESHPHALARTDAALFGWMFTTGLRRSEVVRMAVRDIRLRERRAWVRGKKRDESLPLGASALPFAATLIGGRTDGPLLEGGDGQLRRSFQRWAGGRTVYSEAGTIQLPGLLGAEWGHVTDRLRPHGLRHSFVTALVAAAGHLVHSDKEWLELTRLRSITTLHRYLHVTADPGHLDAIRRPGRG